MSLKSVALVVGIYIDDEYLCEQMTIQGVYGSLHDARTVAGRLNASEEEGEEDDYYRTHYHVSEYPVLERT